MKSLGIKKVERITAVQKVLKNLTKYIYTTHEENLPCGEILAKELGVSRLTVREGLTILEREGMISRIQGKGTYINDFITKLEDRIDLGSDIEGCLKQNGYEVHFDIDKLEYVEANKDEQFKLGLKPYEKIMLVRKILYANEKVAAVYIDRVPEKLISQKNFTKEHLIPCIFPVIEELCQCKITHDVVHMYPHGADDYLSEKFHVAINTPLLRFEVFEYTLDGIPIMYNTEYYTDEFIRFTLCRSVAYKYSI